MDVTQRTPVIAEAGGGTILKCTSTSTSRGSNNNSSLSSDTRVSNESCSWELNGKKIQQNSSRHSFGFDESQVWWITLPSQQTVSICPSRCVNWGYIQFWRATLVNMLVNTVNLTANQVSSKWWVFPWQWWMMISLELYHGIRWVGQGSHISVRRLGEKLLKLAKEDKSRKII